jgi:hypothetical protein
MTSRLIRLTTLRLYSEALSVSVFRSAEHGSGSLGRGHLTLGRSAKEARLVTDAPLAYNIKNNLKTLQQENHSMKGVGHKPLGRSHA